MVGQLSAIAISILFLVAGATAQKNSKKIEAPGGSVSGVVICADTNAPARFAVVTLESLPPEKQTTGNKPTVNWSDGGLGTNATATTDLEGRFFWRRCLSAATTHAEAEIPLLMQGDLSGVELAAPDAPKEKGCGDFPSLGGFRGHALAGEEAIERRAADAELASCA